MLEITRSPPKAIQNTQDVGYYAPGGPDLSKLFVPCTFEFLILAIPYLETHHLRGILGERGGKTPTAGALGRGVHQASTGELDGISQLHEHRAR
jgi:hypothetical protein